MKVVKCRITEQPKSLFDPLPKVMVTLENEVEEFLFDYYPDEISFTPNEFIGLTLDECRHLKFIKDKNYLTSKVMNTPKFYQSVLQEVEGNIFEHVYPHVNKNEFTIEERMGNHNGSCEDCGNNEWMLYPKESYSVRVGGKPYIECINCGHITHL